MCDAWCLMFQTWFFVRSCLYESRWEHKYPQLVVTGLLSDIPQLTAGGSCMYTISCQASYYKYIYFKFGCWWYNLNGKTFTFSQVKYCFVLSFFHSCGHMLHQKQQYQWQSSRPLGISLLGDSWLAVDYYRLSYCHYRISTDWINVISVKVRIVLMSFFDQ